VSPSGHAELKGRPTPQAWAHGGRATQLERGCASVGPVSHPVP